MATNITITTGGTTTAVTIPEVQNTVEVTYGNITKAEREKLAGIEAGAKADQTLTAGNNINVSESGGDYTINLDNTIDISGDATLTNAFVDKVVIRDASSNQLPGNIAAAHFYVDTTKNTHLIAKSGTDLKLKSNLDVDINHGNSGQTTIGDIQGTERITLSGTGLTVKASSHEFTFSTAGKLGIGANSTYYMPVNASGASIGDGLKLGSGGQIEFGSVGADLSTSEFNELSDVDVDYNDWNGYTQGPNILYNALVYDGTNWVMYNSVQGSFPPNITNISFLGDAAPIDKSKIGFDGFNNGLSINSDTSYASSGINLYVNGGARFDGAIQVNDPSSTGYTFPTADGTANQLLATNGSGAVTFVTPSTSNVTEGTNLYYTDARVAANSAVAANTAKISYPTADSTKVGFISVTQAVDLDTMESDIATNNAKVGYTDAAVDSRIAAASIDDLSDVDTSTVAPTTGQALVWDGTQWEPGTVSGPGGSSPWTTSGSDIYYTTGNVGIGTTTPSQPLDVVGDVEITGNLKLETSSGGSVVIGSSASAGAGASSIVIGPNAGSGANVTYGVVIGKDAASNVGVNGGSSSVTVGWRAAQFSGTTAGSNVFVGPQAGQRNTGSDNTVVGRSAGIYTSGSKNVTIGRDAGLGASGGTYENTVAVGYQALTALTNGAGNTAVGYQASDAMTVSAYTTALGYQALSAVNDTTTNADGSTAVGYLALSSLTDATGNTAVGYRAGVSVTGVYNTILGHSVGQNLTTGTKNVVIGHNGAGNGIVSGTHNTVIGYQAKSGGTNSVAGVTAVGSGAGNSGSTESTHIGYQAGLNNGGTYTTNLGTYAGAYGGKNSSVAIGSGANSNAGGSQSVAIGRNATAGTDTVTVGYDAGSNSTDSVFIGYQAGNQETNNNRLYIENSNSTTPLIYGEFDNDILRVNGTLQVNDPSSTGYAFPTATGTLGQVLEVDASGDLVFATPSGGGGGGGLGGADQTLTADRTIDTNGYNLDIELDPTGTADTFTIHDGTHDLFQVDTGTTGTIFSVNDVSGLPKLTVDDSDGVTIDKFKEVKYEKPSNTDFSYQGDVVYFGATTGMTQGDLYYYNSSGNWAQADADAASSSGGVLLAIALGTASDTNGMLLKGAFTMAAGAIDGTEATGDELYVSTTAGHITSDVSAYTTGDVVRVVGYCLDGTNGQIWFNPSNDFIELA